MPGAYDPAAQPCRCVVDDFHLIEIPSGRAVRPDQGPCSNYRQLERDDRSTVQPSAIVGLPFQLPARPGGGLAGIDVADAGDIENGLTDVVVGAPGVGDGTAYLLLGPVPPEPGRCRAHRARGRGLRGPTGGWSGRFDGDGHIDDAVAGSSYDCGAGVAYLGYGPLSGAVDLATAALRIEGSDYLCEDIAGVDAEGDSSDDLLVGSRFRRTGAAMRRCAGGRGSGRWRRVRSGASRLHEGLP